MVKVRFDVEDAGLREGFLRDTLAEALALLKEESQPRWGRMTAQQMVEHLVWAFETSIGEAQVECSVPAERVEKMKTFLYNDKPMLRDFMNPALVEGLPALRFASLAEAKAALLATGMLFLESARSQPGTTHTHPVFGRMNFEEWQRSHFKHCFHHLVQFDLVEAES